METTIPKTSTALASLLRADFTTLVRNRRSVVLALLVPNIILISWKGLVKLMGGPFVLSSAVTIGLMAIGLMGYSISIARDRDKGIFQRLRVAPLPTWTIMMSRITIQLFMIMLLTVVVFLVGFKVDEITLTAGGYLLTCLVAFIGGAVYLGLGQLIVGLIKNPETVNATTRLVYFLFIMTGMFGDIAQLGHMGQFGVYLSNFSHWSPYGCVKIMLQASMEPAKWGHDHNVALLASIGYAVIFAAIGIKNFKWESR
ncbi:ABC transporter permease [Mucilaginibacter sp. AW1-3]